MDPYSLCPCESGKKLKFCCTDIAAEMVKALQLHEGGQSRAARKILEKLHQAEPARAWVSTSYAGVLLSMNEPQAARDALSGLLKETPDHPLGRILEATSALDLDGYDAARGVIHRAFTKGVKYHPEMVGSLAAGVSNILLEEGRYLASRQHMALAMRFVRAEDREPVIMRLLEFDSDKSIPYPLRSVHNLQPLDDLLNEKEQAVFKKALGLSSLGCWSEAAVVANSLTQNHPESADLWLDIALFHAWDGNEAAAAEAFHKASGFSSDREMAISCETLAQLLDHESNLSQHRIQYYKPTSTAQLLSLLDDVSRFVRQREETTEQQSAAGPLAQYQILDREPLQDEVSSPIDFGVIPKFIGGFVCIGDPETNEICRLNVEADFFDEVKEYLESAAGDLLEIADLSSGNKEEDEASQGYESGWNEYQKLDEVFYFDEKTYGIKLSKLEQEKWAYYSHDLWPNTSFGALNGKTPLEAANDSDLEISLAATVNVFDVFADQFNHQLDTDAVKKQLGVPCSQSYEIEDDSQLNSCEFLKMLRVPVGKLSDEQLKQLLNRTQLIQHSRFTEQVLDVVMQREDIVEEKRMPQVLHSYIDLARDNFNVDAALERIQLARDWAAKSGQAFEETLQWEIRELQFRVVSPEDPSLNDFLEKLHSQYLRKLPDLENVINNLLAMHDITPPWAAGNIITAGAESPSSSGGKLWLPGQD